MRADDGAGAVGDVVVAGGTVVKDPWKLSARGADGAVGDFSVGRPDAEAVALRVPAHAPWLARRSLVHRVTRMTCHAPVRTGGAVGAGWDLD